MKIASARRAATDTFCRSSGPLTSIFAGSRNQRPPAGAASCLSVVSGVSGVGVGDDPAPAGGKPPRVRDAPESGGRMVGASCGATLPTAPEAVAPNAAAPDADSGTLLAGAPSRGGTDAGNGADACEGEADEPGTAADAGATAADAGADGVDGADGAIGLIALGA